VSFIVTANLMFLFGSGHVAWARDAIDGIKVDQRYLYVSGPGGLWVISRRENTWAASRHRSVRIVWLGAAKTMTAQGVLYRMRLKIADI
jgi:hypothetical protein